MNDYSKYDYRTGFIKNEAGWLRICGKCYSVGKETIAVWYYQPHSKNKIELNSYFCDDCIERGCSCNFIGESDVEALDELGRQLPCCEYSYNENGYDD